MMVPLSEAAKLFSCSVEGLKDMIRRGMPSMKQSQKGNGRGGAPRLMVDPEICRNWMIENKVRTFMKMEVRAAEEKSKPAVDKPAEKPTPAPVKEQASVNVKPGVDGAVDRLRAIELRAFSDYVRARNSGDVMTQKSMMTLHSEAVKRMLEAEKVVDNHAIVEAEVWGRMTVAMVAWADAIKALVEQMPRALAARCNVQEPHVAEKALRDWLDSQFYPMLGRDPKT